MSAVSPRIRRLRHSMSLTGIIVATAVGVLLPVILSTSVGIVAIALGKDTAWTIFGALVVSFAAAATGGAVVVTVLLSKKNRLARQQADFVANVTHELRTPLTAIRMYAQTIASGALDGRPELLRSSVDTIVRETEWLEAMIDSVLTWRALSKDMDDPRREVAALGPTVQRAIDRFLRMIPENAVALTVALESAAPVAFSPVQIESVVLNLLVNAFKYTREPRRIAVSLRDEADRVVLRVSDNGCGIDPAFHEKIFAPFFRVDARLRSPAAGAGLGLAIVRHHVESHGGTIAVESAVNEGATFVVSLPTAPGAERRRP